MAEIICFHPNSWETSSGRDSGDEVLQNRLGICISGVASLGIDVFPWARQLEICLENLDVVANSLEGQPQKALGEEVKLLRAKLSSAVVELDHKLRKLPLPSLGSRSGPADVSSRTTNSQHEVGKLSAQDNDVDNGARMHLQNWRS